MTLPMEQRYAERRARYVAAMRNEKPDRIPVRPFAAEFTARYAGYSCQDVTHDYGKAFAAVRKCAADFDWDAVVANMVYVWTGLTQALGLQYYAIPGIDLPPGIAFQYREPREEDAFMKPDEYARLIEDPSAFLFNVWLPRVSRDIRPPGRLATHRSNVALVKGGMAMLSYFNAFGPQVERLRTESGTVSAISGILKAPLDILADKLRGYIGLTTDIIERPGDVLAACEALMPHLLHVALSGADPAGEAPVGFWMHRGCVPFISENDFESLYWPTLKPILEGIWARGHQVLCYAEGDWTAHLHRFAELPERSIVFHIDQTDIHEAHRVLGRKFCLSGGVPNYLLACGTPDEVRAQCRKVIDAVARDGGYIMDASAIIQNDARTENVRAMTDFTREYGVYGPAGGDAAVVLYPDEPARAIPLPASRRELAVRPGVCIPWEQKRRELPPIPGDEDLARQVWEDVDALAYTFIWQCLLSF